MYTKHNKVMHSHSTRSRIGCHQEIRLYCHGWGGGNNTYLQWKWTEAVFYLPEIFLFKLRIVQVLNMWRYSKQERLEGVYKVWSRTLSKVCWQRKWKDTTILLWGNPSLSISILHHRSQFGVTYLVRYVITYISMYLWHNSPSPSLWTTMSMTWALDISIAELNTFVCCVPSASQKEWDQIHTECCLDMTRAVQYHDGHTGR